MTSQELADRALAVLAATFYGLNDESDKLLEELSQVEIHMVATVLAAGYAAMLLALEETCHLPYGRSLQRLAELRRG